jgi:2-polyprenyl-3-methyl-5-hydroxy-6-metoxy-1,4-benzoquinol methylase
MPSLAALPLSFGRWLRSIGRRVPRPATRQALNAEEVTTRTTVAEQAAAVVAQLSVAVAELRAEVEQTRQGLRQAVAEVGSRPGEIGELIRATVVDEGRASRRQNDEMARLVNEHTSRSTIPTRDTLNYAVGEIARINRFLAESGLDRWKIQELEGLLRHVRHRDYEADIAAGKLLVPALHTDHPGAPDTDDARFPYGAVNDNSICYRFNSRLYQLFPDRPRLAVLDLGCAGGGYVRSLLDDGHLAVGLEGCEVPKVRRLGEWGTIPRHLHTCDITRPFRLTHPGTAELVRFDAVTMWEVLEHIPNEDLPRLADNIATHLAAGGAWIASVSTIDDGNPEIGAVYHHTVRPREWWNHRFAELGFEPFDRHPFGRDDWLRGSANCRYDRHAEDEGVGFHVVLRRAAV